MPLKLYQRDTGRYPIYDGASNYPNTVGTGTQVIFGTSNGTHAPQRRRLWSACRACDHDLEVPEQQL